MSEPKQNDTRPRSIGWRKLLLLSVGMVLAASIAGYASLSFLTGREFKRQLSSTVEAVNRDSHILGDFRGDTGFFSSRYFISSSSKNLGVAASVQIKTYHFPILSDGRISLLRLAGKVVLPDDVQKTIDSLLTRPFRVKMTGEIFRDGSGSILVKSHSLKTKKKAPFYFDLPKGIEVRALFTRVPWERRMIVKVPNLKISGLSGVNQLSVKNGRLHVFLKKSAGLGRLFIDGEFFDLLAISEVTRTRIVAKRGGLKAHIKNIFLEAFFSKGRLKSLKEITDEKSLSGILSQSKQILLGVGVNVDFRDGKMKGYFSSSFINSTRVKSYEELWESSEGKFGFSIPEKVIRSYLPGATSLINYLIDQKLFVLKNNVYRMKGNLKNGDLLSGSKKIWSPKPKKFLQLK